VTHTTRRRVVHLTSVHPPFDVRIVRECTTLAANGYDVSLVVPADRDDVIDGVKIVNVAKPTCRSQRLTQTSRDVLNKAFALDADVYHIHDPELLPAGLLLGWRSGKRVIYDAHEDVCKSALDRDWIPPAMRRSVSRSAALFLRASVRHFSGIVAAWPNIFNQIEHVNKVLVRNFPLADEYASHPFRPFSERSNVAVYVGLLSRQRGVPEMVQAMQLPDMPDDATLKLAGTFDDDASAASATSGALDGRVEYCGWLYKAGHLELLATAKVGLSVLHPTAAYRETLSTKVFEYMSAGLPVVISNFPIWREIIDETQCGIAVDPMNPRDICNAIAHLLRNPQEAQAMGQRGRDAIRRTYNWQSEARELLNLYECVLRRPQAIA